MNAIWQLDATDTAALIRAGRLSAREVVDAHLARLDAVNPKLHAVVHRMHEQARADADAADRHQRAGGALGPLHGVPITIKITADMAGFASDNGVRLFKDLVAPADAPVVRNLKAAGAVVIGRTNSPAFAMRFMTDNALHGPTLNPWRRDVTCGGSSGGAGAAAAAGIGALAHGTDIGGSIRWPAYCNGIVGLRTTPGRVPSYNQTAQGDHPMAAQLMAVAGPMARSVRDAALAFRVMAGSGHPADPCWLPVPLDGLPPLPRRAALVTEYPGLALHPSSVDAVRRAGTCLAAAGWTVVEAAPPDLPRAFELWEPIGLSDVRARLEPLLDMVGDPGLAASQRAWWAEAAPCDLSTYQKALGERHTLMRRWGQFQSETPIVIMPAGAAPFAFADHDTREGGMRWLLEHFGRFLFPAPVLGLPVLSLPLGQHDGLPQGVQIHAPRYREDLCLEAGALIEAHEGPRPAIDPAW